MIRLIILRIFESYFRHRWLYLLPIVLFVIAGVIYQFVRPPMYMAGGTIYVQKESFLASLTSVRDNEGSYWITPAEATLGEISDLMQTEAFMRSVIVKTDLAPQLDMDIETVIETFTESREAVWLQEMGDNQIFVGALHENPNVSYQLVDGLVENYIQWKINADLLESAAAQDFFNNLIVEYDNNVQSIHTELETYLASHPEPVRGERPDLEQLEIDRLESELAMAEKRFSKALDKDEDARLAASQAESDARQTYVIIDAPYVPEASTTTLTSRLVSIIAFGIIGGVLSIIGIAVGAVLDRSFRFPVDVHQALNLPVLTAVPNTAPTTAQTTPQTQAQPEQADYDTQLAIAD